jgi:hypothetical protein
MSKKLHLTLALLLITAIFMVSCRTETPNPSPDGASGRAGRAR